MKTNLTLLTILLLSMLSASAKVLERWEFSHPDGTQLSQMLSDKGTQLTNKDKPSAKIRKERLEFTGEGDEDSIFLINEFAKRPDLSGVYEVSWVFTSASFGYTHEVDGKANAGIDLRDTGETVFGGKDDTVLAGVRLSYINKTIEIQYQDSEQLVYEKIARIERVVLPEPLQVRILLDFNRAGQPGSMQIFLRLGTDDEINPVVDGILPQGTELKGFRLIQQITNGGANWQKGDYVTIDNFTLTQVSAE